MPIEKAQVLKKLENGFNQLITINPDFEIVPRNKFIHVIINHHKFDDINKFLINTDELEIFFTNVYKYRNLSQFLIMNPSYIDHISVDTVMSHITTDDLFNGHNALCLNKRAHYQDLLKRFDKNTNFLQYFAVTGSPLFSPSPPPPSFVPSL